MTLTYDPTVFNVGGETEAKHIILTPEAGMTPEERWAAETPDIVGRILPHLAEKRVVLDFGCGIGRLSKPLIEAGHTVIGVDRSSDMRRLAMKYVNHGRFAAYTQESARMTLKRTGNPLHAAVAAWVLQHVAKLDDACEFLAEMVEPGGKLFVVNRVNRCIPVMSGWHDDGLSVPDALATAGFEKIEETALGAPIYAAGSVWSVWRRA